MLSFPDEPRIFQFFAFSTIAAAQNLGDRPQGYLILVRRIGRGAYLLSLYIAAMLVVLALFTRKADMLFVVMSWMFVASRLVHAAIHVTSNKVSQRFTAFVVGVLILTIMWVIFAIRVLAAETGV